MKKSEVIDQLEDVVVLLKGDGSCDDLISAVRYAIAVIQGGTSDESQECNAINRDKALSLVLDVCNDVMDECETVTGMCGEEVYTDVKEVDAILKCNKRIRNGIRQLPSEPVGNTDMMRPKGKWIDMNRATVFPFWQRYKCSVCGERADMSNYCPRCGSRMKGENDD